MRMLRANNSNEFISAKIRLFCKKRDIGIKYITPYMHEENVLAKREEYTIFTIKDSILIDSKLLNRFWAKPMEMANYL